MDMLQDMYTGPSSPSKGKGAETGSKTWRTGWWDFYPLLERSIRPLEWSQSSVIFTAHPTQPLITARHFSSSKQFTLPSPAPIIATPGSYDPPTVITVSPGDLWLFAYFPKRDGEGVGCLWKRGSQIDNWSVKEYWTYPSCGGAVAASWLSNHRNWTSNAEGSPTRLPPRGPTTHVADPALLIVTEDHWVHFTYIRFYSLGTRFIKRYLPFNGINSELGLPMDYGDNSNSTRRCMRAAIGLGYSETSVFIATHSCRAPPPVRQASASPFNSMDLSVPVEMSSSNPPDQKPIEWDHLGEERIIELFEVSLFFDGTTMRLYSTALSNMECPSSLTGLTFACSPPHAPQLIPDNSASPKRNAVEKGKMSIVTSSIDFHGYSKHTTSTLISHTFISRPGPIPNNPRNIIWSVQKESTRVFDTGVVIFTQPFLDLQSSQTVLLRVCMLDFSGPIPVGRKEGPIGNTKVLNLSDLSDNTNWEPTPIKCPTISMGRDLPLSCATSPNGRLLYTLSSDLTHPQTAIHPLPQKSSPSTHTDMAVAILGRVSTADLVHTLCSPHVPLKDVVTTIYQTLRVLDARGDSDKNDPSVWDVVGIATDIYRARSRYAKGERESERLKELFQTAHDVCSIAACNIAFEDCQEDEGYDLDAVWQIIAICSWVVAFTEKLMKACVLWANAFLVQPHGVTQQASTDGALPSNFLPDFEGSSPILLHLAHPFALQNLIAALIHVRAFRKFLGSFPAGGEHARIAQSVLIDTVDCAGVNLEELIPVLEEQFPAIEQRNDDFFMSLAECRPMPGMYPRLGDLLKKISKSETILNKSALFIKPSDFMDGMSLTPAMNQRKNHERDVITKGVLDKQGPKSLCSRCGGKTSLEIKNSSRPYPKWTVWELMWQFRCICGGSWLSVTNS